MDFLAARHDPEAEEQTALASFRSFDVDNKGVIFSKDIREILMCVMAKCPEEDKKQILKVFRLERDRTVSYEGNYQ